MRIVDNLFLFQDDEKHHDASDHLKNAAKMLVKQKK